MTTTSEQEAVAAFLANRPYYDPAHVADIAAHAAAESIPFCGDCLDWHHAGDDHSELG